MARTVAHQRRADRTGTAPAERRTTLAVVLPWPSAPRDQAAGHAGPVDQTAVERAAVDQAAVDRAAVDQAAIDRSVNDHPSRAVGLRLVARPAPAPRPDDAA
ncbi:MAG TPA: hypothetical protein VHB02_11640 [Acidimicrobiales bacterium]|nr:hypothetical protein [Acidimicrobiales bacterium]